jgi:tRNA(Ile)-lysidine synthase
MKKISNLEAKCRELRYEFLKKMKKKYYAKYILTAHHLNDNLETFLLNFVRGASLNGMIGMKICDSDILHPFLNIRKEDVLNYCKKNKLKWNEDHTNQDETFARNRLRLKVIPELKKINPNLEKTFLRNIENLRELAECLTPLVVCNSPQPFSLKRGAFLSVKQFKAMHVAKQKMFLIELYKSVNGSTYNLSSSHVDQILKVILNGKGNKQKEFGSNHVLRVLKGEIYLCRM